MKTMQIVREAIQDNPQASADDIMAYGKEKYGIEIPINTARQYRYNIRRTAGVRAPREFSMLQLTALAEMLKKKNLSPQRLRSRLEEIREIAEPIGGLRNLIQALDSIDTFANMPRPKKRIRTEAQILPA